MGEINHAIAPANTIMDTVGTRSKRAIYYGHIGRDGIVRCDLGWILLVEKLRCLGSSEAFDCKSRIGNGIDLSELGCRAWEAIAAICLVVIAFLDRAIFDFRGKDVPTAVVSRTGELCDGGISLYWVMGGSAFGFPRYHLPFVMVGLVLVSPLVIKGWESVGSKSWTRIFPVVAGAIFLALVSGDALFPFYTYPEKAALGYLKTWKLVFQIAGVVGGVLCYGAMFFLLWKNRAFVWWRKIGVISAVILFPWWIGQDVVMSRANYNTAYLYGERGIREVGAVLERSLSDGVEIIAPKDVAYHTDYRFPHQVLGAVCEQGNLSAELARKNVQALVYRDSQWIDSITGPCLASSSIQNTLNSRFRCYHMGNFRVWIKQGDAPQNAGNSP